MIGPGAGARVMVATRPVDFRKGPDALAALVGKEYGGDPYSGVIYVFRAKRQPDAEKADGDGARFEYGHQTAAPSSISRRKARPTACAIWKRG
jgi:transposase